MWPLLRNAISDTVLEGPRVFLRPPVTRDAAAWMALRQASQNFLQPWEPTWPPDGCSAAAFHRRRLQIRDDWRAGIGYSFLIFENDGGEILGGITLSNVRLGVARTGSLGYWVGAPHARKGYMTEAVRCVLEYSFGSLQLHRIEAACLPDNEASKGLLRKCGFREEGLAREYLKINGRWCDHVTFGILQGDSRDGTL
ncbi:MAG: GNAT family N-acetyltransferase [Alphaproteobacteria bacterium]|nr:GNAT family N-acetyltransferase [Alphaproteobacteria bacterium]